MDLPELILRKPPTEASVPAPEDASDNTQSDGAFAQLVANTEEGDREGNATAVLDEPGATAEAPFVAAEVGPKTSELIPPDLQPTKVTLSDVPLETEATSEIEVPFVPTEGEGLSPGLKPAENTGAPEAETLDVEANEPKILVPETTAPIRQSVEAQGAPPPPAPVIPAPTKGTAQSTQALEPTNAGLLNTRGRTADVSEAEARPRADVLPPAPRSEAQPQAPQPQAQAAPLQAQPVPTTPSSKSDTALQLSLSSNQSVPQQQVTAAPPQALPVTATLTTGATVTETDAPVPAVIQNVVPDKRDQRSAPPSASTLRPNALDLGSSTPDAKQTQPTENVEQKVVKFLATAGATRSVPVGDVLSPSGYQSYPLQPNTPLAGPAPANTSAAPATQLTSPLVQMPTAMVDRSLLPQIVGAAQTAPGGGTIDLMLDPPELGRIEIVLELSDNNLRATLNSERASTGDLIRRHATMLAQHFEDAGFENVDLSFAQQGGEGGSEANNASSDSAMLETGRSETAELAQTVTAPISVAGRIDMRL